MMCTTRADRRLTRFRALALAASSLLAAAMPASANASSVGASRAYILIAAEQRLASGLGERVGAIGGAMTSAVPEIGVAVVRSADAGFAARAVALPGLRSVVPDVELQLDAPAALSVVANPPRSGDDDELFGLQWALDAIDAPEAWAQGARGLGARVGVIDTGVDVDHPDLAPNLNLALAKSFVPGQNVAAAPGPGVPLSPYLHHGTWVAGIIAAA